MSGNHSSNPTSSPAVAEFVELVELSPSAVSGSPLLGGKLNLLDGVQVNLSVVVGEARTTVGELLGLQTASLLKIDRKADFPVDVMLNGSVVARGQLVVVDDNFGVRITDVAPSVQP